MSQKIIDALKGGNYVKFRKEVFESIKARLPAALNEKRKEVAAKIFGKN